jgi:hypothetical protein
MARNTVSAYIPCYNERTSVIQALIKASIAVIDLEGGRLLGVVECDQGLFDGNNAGVEQRNLLPIVSVNHAICACYFDHTERKL